VHCGNVFQLFSEFFVMRKRAGYVRPKSFAMIHFKEVAELMHHDVVGEFRAKRRDLLIEAEITAQ
jgi:hypothetical protein